MDIPEILGALERNTGTFPREAVRQAIAARAEIIPHLLAILEQAERNAQALREQEDYMAHIYAMFLLAQFRERRAYPLVVKFFSLPGELPLDLTGDMVTEDLYAILASVAGGDPRLIEELVENRNIDEWTRGAALRALVCQVVSGERSRDAVIAYFKSLFHGRLEREFSQVWNALAARCTDLYPEEVYDEIRQAYADELVEPFYMRFDEVDATMARGKDRVLADLSKERYRLIEDTVKEMEGWACFQPSERARIPKPYEPKPPTSRNAPCPCGSGKKYKRCCGK